MVNKPTLGERASAICPIHGEARDVCGSVQVNTEREVL